MNLQQNCTKCPKTILSILCLIRRPSGLRSIPCHFIAIACVGIMAVVEAKDIYSIDSYCRPGQTTHVKVSVML